MGSDTSDDSLGFAMLGAHDGGKWALEMHAEGGVLVCSTPLDLCAGDGVSVGLRLSSGGQIRFNAQVCSVAVEGASGKLAARIEFTGLSAGERRAYADWKRNLVRQQGSSLVEVEVEHKYRVRRSGGALSVWVSGQLEAAEAEALRHAIVSRVEPDTMGMLVLLLDVASMQLCAEECLRSTRRWLRHLARSRASLGILVGKSSAGVIQFRRLAREVGLGERLVEFDEIDDALPSWRNLLQQVVIREPSSRSEGSLCA